MRHVKICDAAWAHIYATAADMAMATMCAYPPSQHAFPHWKFVLSGCADCLCIDLPDQESDRHNSNTPPPISFQIYHTIAQCTVNERLPLDEKNMLVFSRSGYCDTCKTIQQKKALCDGKIYC